MDPIKAVGLNRKNVGPDMSQVPQSGLINPYDYIDQSNYSLSERGQAAYAEDLAKLQYLADLRQQEFQNEYNSPAHQAQLMREAGLNPDLLGLSGVSDSAGVAPTPMAGGLPERKTHRTQNIENATTIMSVISSTFSVASGLINGALGMFSGLQGLKASELGNIDMTLSLAERIAGMSQPDPTTPVFSATKTSSPFSSLTSSASVRKSLNAAYNNIKHSPAVTSKWWRDYRDAILARGDAAQQLASPYTRSDFNEMIECFRPVAKVAADNMVAALKSSYASNRYQEDYYNKANDLGVAGVTAESDFASRALSRDQDTMMKSMKRPLTQLIHNLDEKAKEGKNWANIALISLYTAMSATIQRSSTNQYKPDGELIESRNTRFNFGF